MAHHITKAERDALIEAARTAITLDETGEIIGGYTPAWQTFQQAHGISEQRARSYVARAARLMRGEMAPALGRPFTVTGGPASVYLSPAHLDIARRAGGGNISEGVRLTLEHWERSVAR